MVSMCGNHNRVGFPEDQWYRCTDHLDFRQILRRYVREKEERAAIGRFLFRNQSWEDSGLAAPVRWMSP
jgi:hypothetical protein